MSFEDDEYWDDEYSDHSAMTNAAVVQERNHTPRSGPDPVLPTRRPTPGASPVDELAARRQRRATGGGKPQAAFDSQRPSWLDDPEFVPIDTSAPNLAG